jgi:hypothetical protein
LFEVRKVHADAFETQVGDDLAYWIGTKDDPNLVGIAWKAEDDGTAWWYAVMNQIAVDLGSECTLLTIDGKNQVFPGSRVVVEKQLADRAAKEIVVKEPEAVVPPEPRRRRQKQPEEIIKQRVYLDGGSWYKWVETATVARELGPFPNRDKAMAATL